MSSYVTEHTAPVWVLVTDGKVTKVVVEDDRLSPPTKILVADDDRDLNDGWADEEPRPITPSEAEQVTQDHDREIWPGWEWGW